MTSEQVYSIARQGGFPGAKTPVEVVETHISWVILTPSYAFKIKKPVRFPYLDFSTLEKREHFCREELRLNRRLAPKMYLGVLPVMLEGDGHFEITVEDDDGGTVIDYAVSMKRVDNAWQMDRLLQENAVSVADMEALANMLVAFHRRAVLQKSETGYRISEIRSDFADLFRLRATAIQFLGENIGSKFDRWQQVATEFLDRHEIRLHDRADQGLWIDGHGDLHARNIFLLPSGPIPFDCIEFNPHYRRLDVLNELAFLCMDLDANGHPELGEAFMAAYLRGWNCMPLPEDRQLFQYFKAYRANVRLKIVLVELERGIEDGRLEFARLYASMLEEYFNAL